MNPFASLALPVDEPARMIIHMPGGGPPLRNAETGEPAWIDLLSPDSAVARAHERKVQDLRMGRARRPLGMEEIEELGVELLAKLTRGWSLVGLDGAPLDVPCSEESARQLYARPSLRWLRDQVDVFVADRGNWVRAKSCSTSPAMPSD